jgi:hypothetical protein
LGVYLFQLWGSTNGPLGCPITHHSLTDDPFDQGFRLEEVSEEFILSLLVDLKVAIAMGSHLMAFLMNDLHDVRSPLCDISQDKEGGLHVKTIEKGKDLFHVGQDPTLTRTPVRRREDVLNIADVIPIFHIHR